MNLPGETFNRSLVLEGSSNIKYECYFLLYHYQEASVFASVCLLSAGLGKKYRTDLHWTGWRDGAWAREESITFWGRSGSFTMNLNSFLWSLVYVVWHHFFGLMLKYCTAWYFFQWDVKYVCLDPSCQKLFSRFMFMN